MNWQNSIGERMDRMSRFVKERGWGPLGSIVVHTMVILLLLGVTAPPQENEIEIQVRPLPPEKPEDPPDSKPPEQSINKPDTQMPDADPVRTSDDVVWDDLVEMPPDPVGRGGDGGGSANTGIGNGSKADGLGFQPDHVLSPLVMPGLYEPQRAGGTNGRAMLLIPRGGTKPGEEAVVKALRWLKDHQNEDGSWPGTDSPTAMCGLALLCYMAHGEIPASKEFGSTVEKAIRYLMYVQEPNGRFKNAGGNYVYGHAIAAYALAESYGMTQMLILKKPLEKAVQVIMDGQQAGGAFNYGYSKEGRRDMSVTGWQVQALKAAKIAGAENKGLDECLYKCVDGVKSFAGPGGGFGYDGPGASPTLTGAGILCLQFLRRGNDPAVESAFKATQDMLPAWPKDGGGTYGWYYMTQARYQKGGPLWTNWNKAMLPMLVKNQQADGHWESGSTHSACPVYDTALCCMCLEVYYRYSLTLTRQDEARRTPKNRNQADEELANGIAL